MSPQFLEQAIHDRKAKTGKYPKAIIPVHLYGMPAKLDEICAIAEKYNIPICEDAAEAIGSEYKGQKCGTFGEFGALSFNGNKMITTSGGGALICRTEEEAKRTIFYATQAREDRPYYYHKHIGYNYRLSNICAGIGRGQMTVLEQYIARRRAIHTLYSENFADTEGIHVKQNPSSEYDSNFWLTCIEVDAKNAITKQRMTFAYISNRRISNHVCFGVRCICSQFSHATHIMETKLRKPSSNEDYVFLPAPL